MKFDIALPGFVKTTKEKYDQEMTRLKEAFSGNDPESWPTLEGAAQEAAYKYVNNVYWCTDTSEIYNKEICYGFSQDYKDQIEELMNEVFPLTWKTQPTDLTYESGQTMKPKFTWAISRKGQEVTPTTVTVNSKTDGVASDKKSYTSPTDVKITTSYAIEVTAGAQKISKTVKANFFFKRYFGTSAKATLTSAEVIAFEKSDFTQSYKASPQTFNCSGGKYPYMCIPKALVTGDPQIWVNGLRTTAITKTDLEVTNASGGKAQYTIIRLNDLQTSSGVSIEIK